MYNQMLSHGAVFDIVSAIGVLSLVLLWSASIDLNPSIRNTTMSALVDLVSRLADQGHTVIGVDISSVALKSFFQEHGLAFKTETRKHFTLFKVCFCDVL